MQYLYTQALYKLLNYSFLPESVARRGPEGAPCQLAMQPQCSCNSGHTDTSAVAWALLPQPGMLEGGGERGEGGGRLNHATSLLFPIHNHPSFLPPSLTHTHLGISLQGAYQPGTGSALQSSSGRSPVPRRRTPWCADADVGPARLPVFVLR